ncbi:MAG TPA: hypothetical protein VFJ72_14790 [Rubrobacteraceae bacterium]|nr:hypothetical protein [Rubrobacteraceae bacterium]
MVRRLLKDESGMTMALAVMMVVIIGVMGAGLLTFTMRDLDTVVQTNQGQTAQAMADAGMQAAKLQLHTMDSNPLHYDGVSNATNTESSWSRTASDPTTWKHMTFGGNDMWVDIKYLPPSSNATQASDKNFAPVILPSGATDSNRDPDTDPDYPSDRHYFRVTVEANADGAVRWYQAIYQTENYNFPVSYFATRDINVTGASATVNGVSLFAQRYITNLTPDSKTGSKVKCGTICGVDQAYSNWATNPDGTANGYNKTARPTTSAGAAALGGTPPTAACSSAAISRDSGIGYASASDNTNQKKMSADPQDYGQRDYDRDSDFKCPSSTAVSSGRPEFTLNTWTASGATQPSTKITFPFAVNDSSTDAAILSSLKDKAQAQNHYVQVDNGSSSKEIDIADSTGFNTPSGAVYPPNSTLDTVMYIEFTGSVKGSVLYKTGGNGDQWKGTIVVINGDLDTSASSASYQGVMIVRDGVSNGTATTESQITTFNNSGSLNIDGYVNVEGDLFLQGSVGGVFPGELLNGIPGVVTVNRWSWRECYAANCP